MSQGFFVFRVKCIKMIHTWSLITHLYQNDTGIDSLFAAQSSAVAVFTRNGPKPGRFIVHNLLYYMEIRIILKNNVDFGLIAKFGTINAII
jgi:hypothetical protein